jgi:PAS domain S-box-containing protein
VAEKLNNKKDSADARPTMNKDSAEAQDPYSGLKCALDRALYLDEVLKTIRNVNQLIIRVNDEQELLGSACHELVQGRHYKLAWIGYTQKGSFDVKPAAHYGFENEYLSSIKVTWDQSEYGRGATGTAIRTGKPVVIQDILNNPESGQWRKNALERGYRSAAAIPLIIDGVVIGAVNLYSDVAEAFDDAELDLLVELAGDISLGIQKIRQRQELKRAEERYRSTLDSMLEGCQLIGFDWRYLYVNDASARQGRHTRDDLLGCTMMEVYPGIEQTAMFQELRRCMETQVPHRMQNEFTFPDGSKGWFELSMEPVPEGVLILSVDTTESRRAREKLKFSEENFNKSFHSSPAAMRLINVETVRLVDANDNFLKLTGYSREEVIGHTSWELGIFKEEPTAFKERCRILKEKGRFTDFQITVVNKSGEERLCLMSGEALRLGDRLYSLSTLRDITEQRRAEEAIRESEEKLRLVFESAGIGIAVTDLAGVITEAKSKMVQTLGFDTKANLVGKQIYEFIAQPQFADPLHMRRTLGKSIKGVEYNLAKADGTRFPGEFTASALKDAAGNLVGFITVVRDISEWKQAEEQIRLAAEEWRKTFDSITDPISIHDRDYRITRVNMAFADLFKLQPKDVVGKHCYELVHGTTQPPVDCPHRITLETGRPAEVQTFEPKLGRYLDISTSPVINDKGEIVGSVHVMRDITERENMEQQLIIADRLASLGELAAGIAHEVNNPLTGVIGLSQLLLDRDLPGDVKEDLQVVHNEAQRAAKVVKNLLAFARKHTVDRQPINIKEVIIKVLELRAYEQKVNNIKVVTTLAPDLPEILADVFQLQQVFFNLVINAEYFMLEAHKKGTLMITTEKAKKNIRISFTDDGPGIPRDKLEHLFTPFFTTKPVGKGTGLGLSICHGVVTAHGGRIWAESEPGKGTTFIIELPIITTRRKEEAKNE